MDESKSASILSGLSEYIQYLCSKHLDYEQSIYFTGHLYMCIDEHSDDKIELVVNETISKTASRNSALESKSYTAKTNQLNSENRNDEGHGKNTRNGSKNKEDVMSQSTSASLKVHPRRVIGSVSAEDRETLNRLMSVRKRKTSKRTQNIKRGQMSKRRRQQAEEWPLASTSKSTSATQDCQQLNHNDDVKKEVEESQNWSAATSPQVRTL